MRPVCGVALVCLSLGQQMGCRQKLQTKTGTIALTRQLNTRMPRHSAGRVSRFAESSGYCDYAQHDAGGAARAHDNFHLFCCRLNALQIVSAGSMLPAITGCDTKPAAKGFAKRRNIRVTAVHRDRADGLMRFAFQ